jgi:chemotaxis protein MotB
MRQKQKHHEHPNHERWLVSYADFITLLFAFFVVMYAMSQVDVKKMGRLSKAMQSAFDTRVFDAGSKKLNLAEGIPEGAAEPKIMESISPLVSPSQPTFDKLQKKIENKLVQERFQDKVKFKQDKRGLVISLVEAGFFNPGEAEIKGSSLKIVDSIAQSILPIRNQIRVEGHTDNTPIHNNRFPSNWELSTARATNVIAYLTYNYAFSPLRLSAAGYGEFRPVASNNQAEGRAANRRVDIVILNEAAERQEPM